MKRFVWLAMTVLFLCTTARAQETPAWEFSAGYSSLTGNLIHPRFHLNGGYASAAGNLNSWFGIALDLGAYYGPNNGQQLMQDFQGAQATPPYTAGSPAAQTFTIGPVFSIRRLGRFTAFARVGIGGMHASQGYLGMSQSAVTFAGSGGGGADFRISRRAAIRVEGDYMTTTFSMPPATFSPGSSQGNVQISAGIVLRLGER
jgi:hypothetical protein